MLACLLIMDRVRLLRVRAIALKEGDIEAANTHGHNDMVYQKDMVYQS